MYLVNLQKELQYNKLYSSKCITDRFSRCKMFVEYLKYNTINKLNSIFSVS